MVKAALSNCISPRSYHYRTTVPTVPACVWDPYQTTCINMIEGSLNFTARLATPAITISLLSLTQAASRSYSCETVFYLDTQSSPPSSLILHPSPTLQHSHHLPLYRPVTRSTAYSASFIFPPKVLYHYATVYP